jgi:hypothetical protein
MNGSAKRRVAVVLAAFVLAGCADAPRTSVTSKAPDTRQFVTTSFPLWVEVRGAPYGAAAEVVGETVTAAMKQAYVWNPAAEFTTDPDKATSRTLKVVMTFNAAAGTGAREQCLDRTEGGGPRPDGAVDVVATLCSEGDALANVRGSIAESEGPADLRFSALIRQVTTDMFRDSPDRGLQGLRIGVGGGGGGGVGIGVGSGIGGEIGVGVGGGGVGIGVGSGIGF